MNDICYDIVGKVSTVQQGASVANRILVPPDTSPSVDLEPWDGGSSYLADRSHKLVD